MPLSSMKLREDDHGNTEATTVSGISAFLGKLWKMVEDPKTDHLISWGKSGNTFVIKNQIDFAKTILPNYYKHNNIASFIRQLNMYGFHKIISTTSGALDSNDNDEIEFTHPCFVRGHPYLLEQIKRKMNNPKENITKTENNAQFNESIKRVLNDIKNLKGKQEHLGSQLCSVKQENEILWRELSLLRQKHAAQQNILNKLIRFLVSLAQPSNHGLVKRRLVPLMLKDSATSSKMKPGPLVQEQGDHVYSMKKRETSSPGPTIHEIHPSEIMDEVQIIDAPVMEVTADVPVVIETDAASNSDGVPSPIEVNVSSPEPIPAALLRSNRKGKKRIQTVYLTPEQRVPTHFLVTQQGTELRKSPEYLIPEQTDDPLMELVHETEADDSSEYITVMADEGTEIFSDSVSPTTLSAPVVPDTSTKTTNKKRTPTTRRKITKRTVASAAPIAPKPKSDGRRKSTNVADEKPEKVADSVRSEDFLFDIDLQNYSEPLIEIHTPGSNFPPPAEETSTTETLNLPSSPSKQLKVEIPLSVGDVMTTILPTTGNMNTVNVPGCSNSTKVGTLLSPNQPLIQSPLPECSDSTALNLGAHCGTELPTTDEKSADDVLIKQINECIDNAQNMKIACTDSTVPPTKAYVDDMAVQLDSMQADINSLKELMQNEGLTLDVNTLMDIFNENPLDYNMPSENTTDFHKPDEEKVIGNELISAPSIFDFTDIFPNEWSQPNSVLSTVDSDYCSLNTPQIERNTDEAASSYPPPNKKVKSK